MTHPDFVLPDSDSYWLRNAHVPRSLLPDNLHLPIAPGIAQFDHLAQVDLQIQDGKIAVIRATSDKPTTEPSVDLQRGMVWCCFVDLHTHLDKGHSWGRATNTSGTFDEALLKVRADSQQNWNPEDVYRRMQFGLQCSYAHGTQAIRTHIDSFGKQADISFGVFQQLRQEWGNRLTLQAVSLVPPDYYATTAGEKLADQVATAGGILGAVLFMTPDLDTHLDRIFALAEERNLNLDFHADESGDPNEKTLRHVAAAVLRNNFSGKVVCGHCCSLSVQPEEEAQKTISLVKTAGIGIVSLPMCNLYLQDRNQVASNNSWIPKTGHLIGESHTPRWRGVTLIHELKAAGVPVAIASDNCRDPFYAFGDHDGLEAFREGVRIAQLESPYGDWSRIVTQTPADLMGLPEAGRIAVGLPANLILFKARYFSELLARSQSNRVVLRNGYPIDTRLPDYEELDDLVYGRED
jgi:cytosine deaminase